MNTAAHIHRPHLEEAAEEVGDGVGVKELEDEATASDAELESGCGIGSVAWEPLNAEADDEMVEDAAAMAESGSEPFADDGGSGGDGGGDSSSVEVDDEGSEFWFLIRTGLNFQKVDCSGTVSGLMLRIGQCLFASASIGVMVSAMGFSNYTTFWQSFNV
ncbi:CASP-like protein 5B1 [Camellia lanceoleosa]|uniref:CASP-like protein 5B1 n=1 Tax=Camellia lanceoleosa TaxID=1840588 RepID=A0ACC0GVC6_9ERIC|nr:CASP-like protein 5B1 [Camellia lanceoleosa]